MRYLLIVLFFAAQLSAHAVGYELKSTDAVQLLSFSYADGKPMDYCEVMVYGPEDEEIEFQNGRTDRRGFFAFLPESSGVWLVEVKDTKGHTGTVQVLIKDDDGVITGTVIRY